MPAKINPAAKYDNLGLSDDVKAKLIAKDAVDAACTVLVSKASALRRTHAAPELREALNQLVIIANLKGLDINEAMAGCGFVPAPKSSKK